LPLAIFISFLLGTSSCSKAAVSGLKFVDSALFQRIDKISREVSYSVRVHAPEEIQSITFNPRLGVREEILRNGSKVLDDSMFRVAYDGKIYIFTFSLIEKLDVPTVTLCDGCEVIGTEYFSNRLAEFSSWKLVSEKVDLKNQKYDVVVIDTDTSKNTAKIEVQFKGELPESIKIVKNRKVKTLVVEKLRYDESKLAIPRKVEMYDMPNKLP